MFQRRAMKCIVSQMVNATQEKTKQLHQLVSARRTLWLMGKDAPTFVQPINMAVQITQSASENRLTPVTWSCECDEGFTKNNEDKPALRWNAFLEKRKLAEDVFLKLVKKET